MKRHPSMVDLAEDYLATRRKLGFALKIEGQQLLAFAGFADRTGHRGPVTTELALRWAKLPEDASPHYWSRRFGIVRRFAKYRFLFDPTTDVPPDGLLGPACRRPTPYIYSAQEIATLLQACLELGPAGGLTPRTFVTLFGLLVSTGLRISEALHLTRQDVDLETGMLYITETKFSKSRLVPLHASTTRELRAYAEHRDRRHPVFCTDAFFVTDKGTPLKYKKTSVVFAKLRGGLDWERPHTPRIHDLRHTFAVNRLLRWYQEGADIDQKIAGLSTYLGHATVTATYWYLTAVPDLLTAASARFERKFGREVQ
ncbi:MAG: tyrosine-type recombinase/integrase [Gemmatimonadota bacterium]|nr:MAG: tyrosine-type recombinase/integrase [Gemmatimonadota bacterium]